MPHFPRTPQNFAPSSRARRRAIVLVIVLVVVVVLSFAAYTFSDLMFTQHEAAQLLGRQLQAQMLTDSGAEAVRAILSLDAQGRTDAGGTFDNPQRFQSVLVLPDDDPNRRGTFSVVAPKLDDQGNYGGVRFGLEDESSRINLNALILADKQSPGSGRTLLKALPGMTDEIADAIMDWLDADDEQREFGAELDYYSGLSPAYAPKNGLLDTVEELLLVRGVTPELLFGRDANRNGLIDPQEQDLPLADGDNSSGVLDRGWSAYLTLYSQEPNLNSQGQPRIYLNQTDMQKLSSELSAVFPEDWVTFIIAYRQNGATMANPAPNAPKSGTLDLLKPAKGQLSQVLELIGAKTQVTFQGEKMPSVLNSPFGKEIGVMGLYLPLLMDNVTITESKTLPGRININQAPRQILAGIPGIKEEMVAEIMSRRQAEPDPANPNRRFETWLMSEGIVTLDEMKVLSPFLCAGGGVYRSQVVGYFQGGGASSRAEVVFDTTVAPPRVLLWRDISHLGRGYALETLGLNAAE